MERLPKPSRNEPSHSRRRVATAKSCRRASAKGTAASPSTLAAMSASMLSPRFGSLTLMSPASRKNVGMASRMKAQRQPRV